MSTIRIIGSEARDEGVFDVLLRFDNDLESHVRVRNPFTPKEEEELNWLFNEHLRSPFTDEVRAERIRQEMTRYGESLFTQVFSEDVDYQQYLQAVEEGIESLAFEVVGPASFHRLHWESMKDPDRVLPFAVSSSFLRQSNTPQMTPAVVQESPTLNILLVVARPGGSADVGHRTISRSLVDTLRSTNLPIRLSIVRPGTYEALATHLEEVHSRYGKGYYHIIHFDTHGAVLSCDKISRFFFRSRYGREGLRFYEGFKAFLFLEGAEAAQADPVEATELASLLAHYGIPISVLNACQSGKLTEGTFANFGNQLIQSGAHFVLTMSDSVTVSAAQMMMRTLYEEIFDGVAPALAVSHGRRELYDTKDRRVHYNQLVELEDWFLPVLYSSGAEELDLRLLLSDDTSSVSDSDAGPGDYYVPVYGFWGRDTDILEIEKLLLDSKGDTSQNAILIQGMAGIGKTAFLQHLSTWWQQTDFVDHCWHFSYEEKLWTFEEMVHAIASELLETAECPPQSTSSDWQCRQVVGLLRSRRHLLIFDALEITTQTSFSDNQGMMSRERSLLRDFLKNLAGGETVVLLGSQNEASWLTSEACRDYVYRLEGLDLEASSSMAQAILKRFDLSQQVKAPQLNSLLQYLAGHPGALEVVLPNLAHYRASEVLEMLRAGKTGLALDDAMSSFETTFSQFPQRVQMSLLCLAPFSRKVHRSGLEFYASRLRARSMLAEVHLPDAMVLLQEVGLCISGDHSEFLDLHLLFTYFLRTRLDQGEPEVSQAVHQSFYELYTRAGLWMLQSLTNSESRQYALHIIDLEHENLLSALSIALDDRLPFQIMYTPLHAYLEIMKNVSTALELNDLVLAKAENWFREDEDSELGFELMGLLMGLGELSMEARDLEGSRAAYKQALEILDTLDLRQDARLEGRVMVHNNLGIVAQEERDWSLAERHYQKALSYAREFSAEFGDRGSEAIVLHQFGMLAIAQGDWKTAERYLKSGLVIEEAVKDVGGLAITCFNLGRVIREQGELERAVRYLKRAERIFRRRGDQNSLAKVYNEFGLISSVRDEWDQAKAAYRQSVIMKFQTHDPYEQAGTYFNLGVAAKNEGDLAEAEAYFSKALAIYEEHEDANAQAMCLQGLGELAEKQQDIEDAQKYYLSALEMYLAEKDGAKADQLLKVMAFLWRRTWLQGYDPNALPEAVASILGCESEDVVNMWSMWEWLAGSS
jgi:tetratricopeptide (TPR) repeat protein